MSSSSSSSTSQGKKYEVFLSFRGDDVRDNFLSHLRTALKNARINAFSDEENLEKGNELGPELMQAIQGSRISIVVFSNKYTESSWCLKEFEEIVKCRRNKRQVVMPLFYHIEPQVVRYQMGGFGNALQATARRRSAGGEMMENQLSILTSTLKEVADLSGWHDKNFKDEAELVSKVVGDVKRKLNSISLNITEYPVGLDTCVQQVIQFIKNQSSKVCLIGIWGMVGSGKTTIARAIYNEFHSKFEFVDHSFIENIKEAFDGGDGEIIRLQKQLISNLLKTNEEVDNTASGIKRIEDILMWKRALIVLDGVSTSEQLNTLRGNRRYFVPGSVLIVTSRDAHILKELNVDRVYSIKEMDESNSHKLFNWHAFGQAHPIENLRQLSEDIVACCGGLPLALEAIGTSLRVRTELYWKNTLKMLRSNTIPEGRVQKALQKIYDCLGESYQRNIFLDICCFFIGKDIAYVTEILNGRGFFADNKITDLIEQSILKVEKNNKLGMHSLLQDMGREIVRKTSQQQPEKRSRLWFHEDVRDVLNQNSGTDSVEGLVVEGLVLQSQSNENVSFKTDSFMKMKNLRLLQLENVDLTGDYVHLSQKLIWLCWQGFKEDCIPDNFYLQKLVVFELERCNIKQVWNKTKSMEELKILNLSYSKHLTHTPDFSKLPNLEKLIMNDCSRLSELHQSIGDLRKILLINLKDCTSLSNFPEKVYQLTSLKSLILSGCSNIDQLEEDMEQMKPWTNGTGVKEILYSIPGLKRITHICGCELSFEVFPSVSWSRMSPTVEFPPCIFPFDNHHDINFSESETSLRSLLIGMGSCQIVIDTLSKSISQGLTTNDSSYFSLLGGNNHYLLATGEGPSARFQVTEDIDCPVKGIILCVAYSSTNENMEDECLTSVLIINYTKCTIQIYERGTFNDEDRKGLTPNLGRGDNVEIFVVFGHGLIVKETTVYIIYGQSITTEFEKSFTIMVVKPSTNMEMGQTEEIPENRVEDHIPPAPPAPPLSPEGNESAIVVFEQSSNRETTTDVEIERSMATSHILEHEAQTVGSTEVGSSSTSPPPASVLTRETFDSYVASTNAINEANTQEVETVKDTLLKMQETQLQMQEAFDSYVASTNERIEVNTKQLGTIAANQIQMQQTLQLILKKLTNP